ncbi:uncharacterized protein Z518_05615 [Rhinocladiella mackenziei CBS 650.93]|uniref:Amidohydrolase-related domain-containing protein n=1 Tax=Rhinocladiella mackenziei CBS 650.93 TaxID=1442369 RepID=A0A0D2J6Q8_9EURO|nr:uncharacterized protein Z518_05615 [Rhinocladiella mackenziei CBS 650.93]KIX04745.1 hypothetical protein Z518_05615 [Rhinocladiella mackenziei CBS 650.93]
MAAKKLSVSHRRCLGQPSQGAAIPEVARLFAYSHSDPEIADRKRTPDEVIALTDEAGFVGLRVVPWLWNLPPTDSHCWPLYVNCIELDIPFFTQVGHTAPACPSEVGRHRHYCPSIS